MRLAILIFVSFFLAFPAQAATVGPGSGNCTWQLSGTISTGDADRLASLVPVLDDAYDHRQRLCLDSPGGTLAEAVALGKLLVDRAVATELRPGASCMSACAVLFMLGTTYDKPVVGHGSEAVSLDGRYPARRMATDATLGFHRPALSLPEGRAYSSDAVQSSFDLATDAALELTVLSAGGWMDADLLQEMFAHRGDDFFLIDTVGKALRWQIGLIDPPRPDTLDKRAAWNMCNNLVYLRDRYEPQGRPYLPQNVEIITAKAEGGGPFFYVKGADSDPYSHDCYIMQADVQYGPGRFWVCGWYGPGLRKIGETRCDGLKARTEFAEQLFEVSYSTINGFDPGTPLRALATEARAIEARAASDLAAAGDAGRDALRQRCNRVHGLAYVTGVQNFTNMRARPSTASAVVAQLPLGSRVQEVNLYQLGQPTLSVTLDAGAPSRCKEVCVFDAGPQSRDANYALRQQCFDSGAYWYELSTQSRQRGFVNGKFLRY